MRAPSSRKLQTLPLHLGRCCGDRTFTVPSGLKQMTAGGEVVAEKAAERRGDLPAALEAKQKFIKHKSKNCLEEASK